jgi:TupA-like ATPgrasp
MLRAKIMRLLRRIRGRLGRAEGDKAAAIIEYLEWRDHRKWRARQQAAFRRRHGYPANLRTPNTFSEKLFKRILEGHDPLYQVYAVKLFAHHFVKARAIEGLKVARHLKVVNHLEPSDFSNLPDAFIIKSSFGSGLNEVVPRKSELNIEAVCKKFNARLHKVRNARNLVDRQNVVIFEEYIGDPATGTPDDYKFHCFNSKDGSFHCFIQMDSDRFTEHRQTILDHNFTPVEMQFGGQQRHDEPLAPPARLKDMLRIVRELSSGFDYIRIDLFHTEDGIYFGEITPFHQSGLAPISPPEWEERLGQLWDQRFPDYQPKANR